MLACGQRDKNLPQNKTDGGYPPWNQQRVYTCTMLVGRRSFPFGRPYFWGGELLVSRRISCLKGILSRRNVVSYGRGREIWHQPKKCTIIREIPTKLPHIWICVILHTMLLPEKMASPKPPKPHPPPNAEPGYTKITMAPSSEPPNAAKTPRSVKEQPKTP